MIFWLQNGRTTHSKDFPSCRRMPKKIASIRPWYFYPLRMMILRPKSRLRTKRLLLASPLPFNIDKVPGADSEERIHFLILYRSGVSKIRMAA